jgi:penicillin-binding protein 1A
MVVQNPINGRVLAMQGGFDSRISSFNRATQAQRQPGSTIKPFVYATALDNGMTPTSIIVDAPFCVYQSAALGQKCFRNFGGSAGAGPQTMRWGLEQSRNLMTVRAANDSGMVNVSNTLRELNIGDYPPYLSFALGAGDTTVMKMTNAYSMLVNHGRELKPTLIDYVQARNGKVIWPAKWKPCEGCNQRDWNGKPMPRFRPGGKQVMDPVTAYQVVHMLEGVVQRGTATILRDLNRPLFGKTGTSSGPTNVWFVGGTPNVVAGVYLGFDQPRNMGGYAQGGSLAAPIFKQFAREAFAGQVPLPFTAPNGVRLVRVDRKTGKRVYGAWPDDDPKGAVIWEAFKAETEPKRSIRQEELAARGDKPKKKVVTKVNSDQAAQGSGGQQNAGAARGNDEFLNKEGGIY